MPGVVLCISPRDALRWHMHWFCKHHHPEDLRQIPHNTMLVFLGMVMIWFRWLGFNVCSFRCLLYGFLTDIISQGGSTLNASMRAMVAIFNTNAAACTGILGWVLVDLIRHRGRFSIIGACEGAIWLAACIGFITGIICALLQNINTWLRIDDGMDVFKLHGIGGMVGAFLTGIFATEGISGLDGATFQGGALDGHGVQVGRQLTEVCAMSGYAFSVSCLLLHGIYVILPVQDGRRCWVPTSM